MPASWLALFLFVIPFPGQPGRSIEADGRILAREPYAYPPVLSAEQRRLLSSYYTPDEYEEAMKPVRVAGDTFERVTYSSDGLKVVAYVYTPATAIAADRRLPVIVYNRGSGPMPDQGFVFAPFFHRLAREGFVIVAPQYRQGAGGEGRDEMGGADVDDVMNVLPLVEQLSVADPRNLFFYGESRGGMMTFQAIRRGFPARAAATFGAFTDLEAFLVATPDIDPNAFWPDWNQQRADILLRRSALRWADELSVPLLLMHGGSDGGLSPNHTLRLAARLQELGKPYSLVVYAYDRHVLRQNQIDRDRRAVDWFRRHLK